MTTKPEDIFRPVRDVTTGALPPPLEHHLLHPTLDTFIYAFGGSGKGVVCAWCAAQDTKAGKVIGILDYENNPDEWYRRVERFGGDLDLVRVVSPAYEDGGYLKGPVWNQAEDLAAAVKDLGIERVYVDSVVPATEVDENQIGSPSIPTNYFRAMRTLAVPTVSIGHAAGAMDKRSLLKPWGSHYWRNVPRITWALWLDEKAKMLEAFVTKRNAYRKQSYSLDWSWSDELGDGETPNDLTFSQSEAAAGSSQADIMEDYLVDRVIEAAHAIAPDKLNAQPMSRFLEWLDAKLPEGKRGSKEQRIAAIARAVKSGHLVEISTGKFAGRHEIRLYHLAAQS